MKECACSNLQLEPKHVFHFINLLKSLVVNTAQVCPSSVPLSKVYDLNQ